MKRIKLLFGSALALVLALSLFVPATVSAEEPGTTPDTITPTAIGDTMDQAAFNVAYPDGVKQGEEFDITPYYTGDATKLKVSESGTGEVIWITDENDEFFDEEFVGIFAAYRAGDVTLTFTDEDANTYTLSFTITETPVDIVLVPTEVKLPVGESQDIIIDTEPEDAWWFWLALIEDDADAIMVTTTISDTSVIKVEELYDEDGVWIGYTVTGLKTGTATISIETDLGDVSVATIEVFDKQILQPPVTDTTTTTKPAVAAKNGGPATGDTTNTTMYMLMMLAALASVSGYAFLKKQK